MRKVGLIVSAILIVAVVFGGGYFVGKVANTPLAVPKIVFGNASDNATQVVVAVPETQNQNVVQYGCRVVNLLLGDAVYQMKYKIDFYGTTTDYWIYTMDKSYFILVCDFGDGTRWISVGDWSPGQEDKVNLFAFGKNNKNMPYDFGNFKVKTGEKLFSEGTFKEIFNLPVPEDIQKSLIRLIGSKDNGTTASKIELDQALVSKLLTLADSLVQQLKP